MRVNQVQFAAIQQLPLHFFARLQPDSRRQGEWKTHVEPRLLSARANRLDPERKGRGHNIFSTPTQVGMA